MVAEFEPDLIRSRTRQGPGAAYAASSPRSPRAGRSTWSNWTAAVTTRAPSSPSSSASPARHLPGARPSPGRPAGPARL